MHGEQGHRPLGNAAADDEEEEEESRSFTHTQTRALHVCATCAQEALLGLELKPPACMTPPPPTPPKPLRTTRASLSGNGPPARFLAHQKALFATKAASATAEPARLGADACDKAARRAIDETRAVHAEFWKGLERPAPPPPASPAVTGRRPASASTSAPISAPAPAAAAADGADDLAHVALRLAGMSMCTGPVTAAEPMAAAAGLATPREATADAASANVPLPTAACEALV